MTEILQWEGAWNHFLRSRLKGCDDGYSEDDVVLPRRSLKLTTNINMIWNQQKNSLLSPSDRARWLISLSWTGFTQQMKIEPRKSINGLPAIRLHHHVAINNAAGGVVVEEVSLVSPRKSWLWYGGILYRGLGISITILAASATHQGHLRTVQHRGEFITNTGLDSLVRHTSPQFVYVQRIGPQPNLAGKGIFVTLSSEMFARLELHTPSTCLESKIDQDIIGIQAAGASQRRQQSPKKRSPALLKPSRHHVQHCSTRAKKRESGIESYSSVTEMMPLTFLFRFGCRCSLKSEPLLEHLIKNETQKNIIKFSGF